MSSIPPSQQVRFRPPWARIDYTPWKPEQPPPNAPRLVTFVTERLATFLDTPDEDWCEILAQRPDQIDRLLYMRYQTERARRVAAGESADHPVPIYTGPASYKRCYIKSPASFAELVQRKRKVRRGERRERPAPLTREEIEQLWQARAEAAAAAEIERQAAEQRLTRSIRRWATQGLSRNTMAQRIGGRRAVALQRIAAILGDARPEQRKARQKAA